MVRSFHKKSGNVIVPHHHRFDWRPSRDCWSQGDHMPNNSTTDNAPTGRSRSDHSDVKLLAARTCKSLSLVIYTHSSEPPRSHGSFSPNRHEAMKLGFFFLVGVSQYYPTFSVKDLRSIKADRKNLTNNRFEVIINCWASFRQENVFLKKLENLATCRPSC